MRRSRPRVRTVAFSLAGVLVVGLAYVAYDAWRLQGDLSRAQQAATALQRALDAQNPAAMRTAATQLELASRSARDRSDGPVWGALTHVPLLGDDVAGVRALSHSLDVVASRGVGPLVESADLLDEVMVGGRVDVEKVRGLAGPVAEAHDAFNEGAGLVEDLDSDGYLGSLRSRFDDYVAFVTEADRGLGSAVTATRVLPGVVGADGPRDYLLVFQNNAEIRAAGGLAGSWARVHAEDGVLTMEEQGAGGGFGERETPVLPLSMAEQTLYGEQLGTYFRNATVTPDFPRAAELLAARWEEEVGGVELDGVMSIDVVGMSYVLDGVGPVTVPQATLTSDNLVELLLSAAYADLPESEQNAYFDAAARAIFVAAKGRVASSGRLVKGFDRAAQEGRFRFVPFVASEREALSGSPLLGALSGDDGPVPHVDVDLNDATGSKMSYYLRADTLVTATGCADDRQSLTGRLELSQTLPRSAAKDLPDYVTGAGEYGTEPGSQLVLVRLHAPFGGGLGNLRVDGQRVDDFAQVVVLAGRPAVTLNVLVTGTDPAVVEWDMETGAGQVGSAEVRTTPGVTTGATRDTVASAC